MAFFIAGLCSAQLATINKAEYFWDTDPGEGNGTAITAFDGNYNTIFEKFAITGLDAPGTGLHTFSVRVKDNLGIWGPAFTNIVKVEPTTTPIPTTIAQAEYFWDNDPGEGNGTDIAAFDGNYNSVVERFAVTGLGAPSVGLHKFSVRVKDDSGIWGPVSTNIINVEATTTPIPVTLAQAEYFWDNDPGEGNGASLSAVDGSFDDAVENILKNNIPIAHLSGLHIFNVRVKDSQGVWGTVFKNVLYIESTVLGTQEVKAAKNIVCYPNPADDIIKFNAAGKINIYSSEGRLVISKDKVDGSKGIDVTSLTKGNYILTLENKDGNFSSKFIKK